ncbi:metalloendopeptidase, partial [Coemansia brasiliensis]
MSTISSNSLSGTVPNFKLSPEDIVSNAKACVSKKNAVLAAVAQEACPTFETVFIPIYEADNTCKHFQWISNLLADAGATEDIRDAATAASKLFMEQNSQESVNKDVYKNIHAVYENRQKIESLSLEDQRLVEKVNFEYQCSGIALDNEKREHLLSLKNELHNLSLEFSKNCSDQVGKFSATREELDGFPEDCFEDLEAAEENGTIRYVLTTDDPIYFPVMQFVTIESTRMKMYMTDNNRCPENIDILQKIIKLRHDMAQLLGYPNYSEFILKITMAKGPEAVNSMLDDLCAKLAEPDENVWHSTVDAYEVQDSRDSTYLGKFYTDLYSRDGKSNGAACYGIKPGFMHRDGTFEHSIAALVGNLAIPTTNSPELISHDDVVTIMHELGHVFHRLLSKCKWAKFQGTSVERDFVEAPSQMLENWAWNKGVLSKISRHYKTGEPLPDKDIDKLIASRDIFASTSTLSQLVYAKFDMCIHSTDDGYVDVVELYRALQSRISMSNVGGRRFIPAATFTHLVEGYDSRYYAYLWSEVFSADMFYSRFLQDGLDNPQTGMDYRNEILLPGGSRDAM